MIPEGEYGGGTVMVWDIGVYAPENTDNVSSALAKGELKFVVLGKKLKGSFVLVRTRERQWLLMKHKTTTPTKARTSPRLNRIQS